MLTVEDYIKIRTAKRDGMSLRAICRTYHHSHHTVTRALNNPEPAPYTRSKPPRAPVLGPFMHIIDQILLDDRSEPGKQQHKASKIYRRLRDEYGYNGGYDQVRRYVKKCRRKERETFIPLAHYPGQRLEADFGHIHVDFPEGRKKTPVLITTWSHSGFRFAISFPTERLECVLTGLVQAFEFFGCVPKQLWWDNPKTVVTEIFKGRRRTMHPRYAALASHYTFEPLFCMPAKANEKPHVENSVFDLQRDWATPVPKVRDHDELNEYLRRCCLRKLSHRQAGKTQTVGERFEQDKAAALALPKHGFDPCVASDAKVDKYQTVRFETNRYSVPRRWAFETVTVKAYPFHIRVVASDLQIARHQRCYLRNQQILEPMHYLAVLGRRPAALDHSDVFRNWQLPACFIELRALLENRHGPFAGARQYIRILQLLAEHPVKRIQKGVQLCMANSIVNVEMIINRVNRLARSQQSTEPAEPDLSCYRIQVPKPDLSRFDQYLTVNQGEASYVRQ
ncbi:MAG: IS21 family transposase [Planctomycetota bacterium]